MPSDLWAPSASLETLKARARLLDHVRAFFLERGVLEVDTPALSDAAATDPNLHSMHASTPQRYLQTSPEFPMKRLLAAGSGDIYQICKVFRSGEAGRHHNPEFTMLEWYRVGFDHHQLMDETAQLLEQLLGERVRRAGHRLAYREAFLTHVGVDPFTADIPACRTALMSAGVDVSLRSDDLDLDGWLDIVASHLVYPRLGDGGVDMVYDFPVSQAALARIRPGDPPVAERFEAFFAGVELGNGFHELTDAAQQRARFAADNRKRQAIGLPQMPQDERLLAALDHGLPDCAGVAVGLDRVLMLAMDMDRVGEVMAFDWSRA